jgi:hypothetical protein
VAGNPYLWSTTAASNDSIDPEVSWIEGQLPGTVNNSARALMAGIAGWLKDTNGTLTTGGSSNAYTLTSNIAYSSLATGISLLFKASFSNTGAATLNVTPAGGSAFGAKAIRILGPSGERDVAGNQIRAGGHYIAEYDAAANGGSGAWLLLNPTVRIRAVAPQFFVRSDGSDSNDGLANTSARAFLTIQKAVDTVLFDYDCGNSTATVNVADGTYDPFSVSADGLGSNQVLVLGNTTTPGNCIINTTSGSCVTVQDKGILTIQGFKLTGPGVGLFCRGQSAVIDFSKIHWGSSITTCVFVGGAGGSVNGGQNCNVLNNVATLIQLQGSGAAPI